MPDESHRSNVAGHAERRRHPRCKIALPVEVHAEGTSAPLRTTIEEISPGGCYIETMFTLAVGTKLTMILWLEEARMEATGVVATCYPQVGNGIEFIRLRTEDGAQLEQFVAKHAHPD